MKQKVKSAIIRDLIVLMPPKECGVTNRCARGIANAKSQKRLRKIRRKVQRQQVA
jgi:hypothetical protein